MNTVSIFGDRWRFINAIWYSYSKSLTARRPRISSVAREVHQQPAEALRLDPRVFRERIADHAHSLLDAEEGLLGRIGRDGDDQMVDEAERADDEILVSAGD